ncbi:MAG: ABC transporter ATP-binding protein [Betaproteobacteria bacterium]|nr:ABC transporter ATP-binding protein [Betaproteobacteria bacterium]
MNAPLLSLENLHVAIGGRDVVRDLHLDLHPGERLVVLGQNGVGKSTLLHVLAGLMPPQAGEILLDARPYAALSSRSPGRPKNDLAPTGGGSGVRARGTLSPRAAARLRGLLTQHPGDAFASSVLETVLCGRHPHLARFAWEGDEDRRIAQEALAQVGLADYAGRELQNLSGGERQRVALAVLLAQSPRLYLLDEPLTHLDLHHQIALLDLMSRQAREAATITVLHDVNLAARHADRALLLFGDGAFELGPAALMFTAERLSRLYGHPLRALRDDEATWFVPEMGNGEAQ